MTLHPTRTAALILGAVQLSMATDPKYSIPPPDFFHTRPKGEIITAGDVLSIRFYYNPESNKTVKVRDDGKISLDLFQGIDVAGQTPEELRTRLVALYSREFTNPEITVDVESRANNSAFVTGEVLLPGAKEVHGRMTVATALAMSQVNPKTAGTKSVLLIRRSDEGNYRVYKLDGSFLSGAAREIEILPGDILFVPRKSIVKANDFIEQYVRQLLPVSSSAAASVFFSPGSALATNPTNH